MADDLQLLVSVDIPKSVGNINGQIDQLSRMVKKLEVEVELKGLDEIAKKLGSFNKLESSIKDVGRALDSVKSDAKGLDSTFDKLDSSLTSASKSGKQFENVSDSLRKVAVDSQNLGKTYNELGSKIKSEMKDIGLAQESLKFTELKDGAGNLKQLEAQFTSTTGVIKKFKYEMGENDTLNLISSKTVQNAEDFQRKMSKLKTEIESFRSVIGDASADKLLSGLENGSTSIEKTTQALKRLVATGKEIEGVSRAMQKLDIAYSGGKISGGDYDKLARSLKDGSLALSDFNTQLQRAQTAQANNTQNINQEISLNRQRIQAYNQLKSVLNNMGENIPKDVFAKNTIEDAVRLTNELSTVSGKTAGEVQKLVNEYRGLISPLRDIQMATKKNDLLGDITKQVSKIDRIKQSLNELGAQSKFDDNIVEGFRNMEQASEKTEAQLKRDLASIKQVASQASKELSQALKMENFGKTLNKDVLSQAGGINQFKEMMNTGNIAGVKEFISNIASMEAQTVKLKTAMTATGEPVKQLAVGFKSSGQEMKNITYTMDTVTGGSMKLRAGMEELTFNANRNLSTWEQLKKAMSRFGTWAVAQEGIQGVSRALRSMMDDLLETDRQITDIKRVIGDNIDINVLQKGAMSMATELGNNFHDVFTAVGDISRAYGEFNEQQTLAVAHTATLMSNVSDIGADEAISSLIGTMKAFNIEAQDSVRIVDAWNEVDNNFAVSTEQIASAFEKSGATAKTFGVSMEENLGNITAIGEVTMETGQVIGNSLKTIYSRITTLEPAKNVLKSVGVAITEIGKDGKATSRSVQDILGDLAGKWDSLSSAQQQNIGVQVAGRNQLSRFLALMNNWETSEKAIQTAMNSSGGAMRENQAYLDSYEAKINRMKNTFSQLGQTVGNAFLKSGLDLGISAITDLMNAIDAMVSKFGALGTVGALVTPIVIAFTGLKTKILEISKLSWSSQLSGGLKGFRESVTSAFESAGKSAQEFKQKLKDAQGIQIDFKVDKVKGGLESVTKSVSSFKNSAKNIDSGVSSEFIKLSNNVKTAGTSIEVTGRKVSASGKTFKLALQSGQNAGKTLEASMGNVKTVATQAGTAVETAGTKMGILGSLGSIASAGVSALGVALKGVLVGTAVGLALTAVGAGIEMLISHFAKAKKAQEEVSKTNKSMVDSYRSSGDQLNGLIDKYSQFYQKWGDINDAMDSGRLTEELNPTAYKEYGDVVSQLANKMPQLVEYTDAQGRAHLKNAESMKQVVAQAKELSRVEAQKTKDSFAKQLKDDANEIKKSASDYEKAGKQIEEAQNRIKDAQTKLNNSSKSGSPDGRSGVVDGSYRYQAELGKYQKQLADAQKAQAQAQEEVRGKVQESVKTLKEYGATIIEAEGYTDKLGSSSKAMIQNFAQMNSSMVENLDITKYSSIDSYMSDVTDRISQIKQATEIMGSSMAHAMDSYVSSQTEGITSTAKLQEATSQAKSEFDSFAKTIPQSMQTFSAVADGTFTKVMDNSKKLIDMQKGFADGSVTYSQIRTELEHMGLSTESASQYMRNLAQEAGNTEIQASLLASTTDELSDSMNSLKDSTNTVVDSFKEIAGISTDNISALTSYTDGLKQAKDIYGESAEKSDLYKNSIEGLSTMFGVSVDAVKNNVDGYTQLSDTLTAVQNNMQDSEGNARTFQQAIEATGGQAQEAFEKAKSSGRGFNDELMELIGLTPSFEEMASKISGIDFSNQKDQMGQLVQSYMEGKTSFEEFSNQMQQLDSNFNDTAGIYDTIKTKFAELGEQLYDTAQKTGDTKQAFADMKEGIKAQLQDLGLPPNVVDMMMSQLETLANQGLGGLKQAFSDAQNTLNQPLKVTVDDSDASAKIKAQQEAKERLQDGRVEIPVGADTTDADTKLQKQEEAKQRLQEGMITIPVGADTSNAETGLNTVEQQSQELDAKEIDISANLNLTSGWENNKQQLSDTIQYMEENDLKQITIEGKSVGLSDLQTNLTNVENGIKNAVDTAGQLGNVQQVVSDTAGNVVQLGDSIKEQMGQVADGLKGIGDSAGKVGEIQTALEGLLDPISQLHKGVGEASSGLQTGLDQLISKAGTVGGQLETFKGAVTTIQDSTSAGKTNVDAFADGIQHIADKASGAGSGLTSLSSGLTGIGASINSAFTSIQSLNDALTRLGSTGVSATTSFISSMSGMGSSISSATTGASNSFSNMTNSILSSLSGAVSAMSSFNGISTTSALSSASGWLTLGTIVSASANTMRGSLSGIASSMGSVASSTTGVTGAMGSVTSSVSVAVGALQRFVAVSQQVGSSGASMASNYVGAMTQIAGSAVSASSAISSGFASMGARIASAVSQSIAVLSSLVGAMNSIRGQAQASAMATGSAWQSAGPMVAGASATIIGSLSGIIGTMNSVASSARTATSAIASISGAVAGASASMSSFMAMASQVSAKASQIQSDVARANSAKASLDKKEFTGDLTELVGVMKQAIGKGDPSSYTNIAIENNNASALSALGLDISSVGGNGISGASGTLIKREKESAYDLNEANWGGGNGRKYAGINKLLGQMEAKLKGINKLSSQWRGTMDVINKQTQSRLNLLKQEYNDTQKKMKQTQAELAKLPAVGSQNEAQRKKYNELQKQYDDLIKSQSSLAVEIENLAVEIKQNNIDIFNSFIDEIVEKYEKAISALETKVNDYDFELEVISYVDSDNISKQLDILKKKQQDQLKIQSHYSNLQTELQKQYNDAVKKFGANDERTLHIQEQLNKAKEEWQNITLDVLKNEKEIADIRSDVADKSIDKLKDYYENMKKMSLDAIKAEQDALKKAQEKKNAMYDEEIQKIKDVYSAKFDQMDKEKEKEDYDNKMSDLTSARDDLQKQIALAERDTSLAGKKKLADLQKQLEEQNKAIAEAQKERQDQLLKEQLEAEQQAQIDAIEKQKEEEEKALQDQLDALDEKADSEEKKYDDILNNDEYWANMKDKIVNGDLSEITNEMQKMYDALGQMGQGSFDGLIDGFDEFSKEAQDSIKELYDQIVKNMQFGDGTNILDILAQLSQGQNGYKPSNGNGGNKQNPIGTPTWMTNNTGYKPDNYLTASGTAPAPSGGSGGNGGKPAIGGTYVVKVDVGAYYTSMDARDHRNRLGTVKKGTFWIYNIYIGMINVTNQKGAMGSWINPADNKGGLDVNGNTVKSSELDGKIEEGAENTSKPTLRDAMMQQESMASKMGASDLETSFDSGNGNLGGSGFYVKRDHLLSASDTERVMKSTLRDKFSQLTPSVLSPAVGGLARVEHQEVTREGDIYNISIPVKSFTGTKRDRDDLLGKVGIAVNESRKRKGKKF